MAKILYLSPEHVSGGLTRFQKGHRARGHECRFVTFYPSPSGFPEDICLRLPLMPDSGLIRQLKRMVYRGAPHMQGQVDLPGYPPVWRSGTAAEAVFFYLRDRLISGAVGRAVRQYGLNQYDVYHLDQGLDFYRDARFVRAMKARGARIVCFYHGTDLRNRGVIPEVDRISDLNLTSELDLLAKHPRLRYLHLPFDVERFEVKTGESDPLIIGHACRAPEARHFKGTDRIIAVVKELEADYPVRLDLVEGVPHDEAMRRKARWDVAVDQIADRGGWGYGMNSLETLALGLPTCTRMNPECDRFFAGHPFINVDPDSLKSQLIRLIENPQWRRQKGVEGRDWVWRTHRLDAVMDELYAHYQAAGIRLEPS
ncbi:MAG: glycosyltransferase family 1 protein [Candidatus Zixiibacteriota bacterium]|nr:MAG: glycosyltransferase family 1 protein [candidate division Zixibacteria bacterium]